MLMPLSNAVLAFILLFQNRNVPEFDAPTAIRNATVVTAPGESIDHATILIEHGRIAAIGPDVTIKPGTREVDGAGLYAYAGFIDAFSRAGVGDGKPSAEEERRVEDEFDPVPEGPRVHMDRANRNGIYARRRVEDLLDFQESTYANTRAGGFTSAMIAPPQGIISGLSGVFDLGDQPLRRSILAGGIAQIASFSSPGAHNLADRGSYPGTAFAVIAHLRQTLDDARWYAGMGEYVKRHPEARADLPYDRDLEALQSILDGRTPVIWEVNGHDEILRAVKLADEYKLKLMIAGGREAYRVAEQLKAAKVPILVSIKLPKKPDEFAKKFDPKTMKKAEDDHTLFGRNWDKRPFQPAAAYDEAKRQRDEEVRNLIEIEKAGLTWCLTSRDQEKPADTLEALREIIEAGLPVNAAVAGLTTTPAKLFGVDKEVGSLKPGLRANITLFSKALNEKEAKVRYVFVDGREYEMDGGGGGPGAGPAGGPGGRGPRGAAGVGGDRPRRGGGGQRPQREARAPEEPKEAAPGEEPDATSQPASQPASQATSRPGSQPASSPTSQASQPTSTKTTPQDDILTHKPDWAIETRADRDPGLHTSGNILLKNALVLTVSGENLPGTSVLVQGGKISKIGKDLTAPAGTTVVDLTGYVLMPGILDGHSHIALDSVNEGSLSITCEVRCADVVNSDDISIYRALAGGVTTIHAMHGSANTIGGQCVLLKLKYGKLASEMLIPDAQRTVKFATGENVKRGGMPARGGFGAPGQDRQRRFPGTRMGVEAVMRRGLQAGKEYLEAKSAYERDKAAGKELAPFRKDQRLEALADIVDGKIWINSHCYRSDEILQLLRVTEDFGIRVANLHHCLEAYRIIPELARAGVGCDTFADWWAYKVEAYEAIPQNVGMLLRGGINAAVKSDSAELMRHLNFEAAKAMKYSDLTENEALRICTLNVARQFALDKRVGSIEVGKEADLAIFDGHPLDTFSHCVMTLVEGEVYFRHRDFDPNKPAPAHVAPRSFAVASSQPTAQEKAGAGHPTDSGWKQLVDTARQPGQVYAIMGATLHPVSGPPINDGTLIIKDGKISAIGEKLAVPGPAHVIKGQGLHVWPGLINAATTVGLAEIGAVDVTNDTNESGSYLPDLKAVAGFHPHSEMIEVARGEGITLIHLTPTDNLLAPQSGLLALDGWTMDEMVVNPRAALVVSLPSKAIDPLLDRRARTEEEDPDFVPQRRNTEGSDRQIKELETFFRSAKIYADGVAAAKDSKTGGPAFDSRFDAVIPYVTGRKPVVFSADSYKQILEALLFAEQLGLKPIILGGRGAWKCADVLISRNVPVIYDSVFDIPGGIEGLGMGSEPWDSNYRGLALLAKSGVKFCLAHRSSDLAKLLPVEAGFAVGHGLDPDTAVRALTLSAAEILGIADKYGSLEAGKVADVIVTTDHVCQASSRVVYEFIRGRPVLLESKHTREAAKFANRPAPELPPDIERKGPKSQTKK